MFYLYPGQENRAQPQNAAISGFLKSISLEYPKLICKIIELQSSSKTQPVLSSSDILNLLLNEFQIETKDEVEIRYNFDRRYVKRLKEFYPENEIINPIELRENGVYSSGYLFPIPSPSPRG